MNVLEINSWWGYFLYILKRNRGYGYRKLLNTFNELAELACYSWLFSESLLKDYLIIPLFFIIFSFILDQIIFSARVSQDFNVKKIKYGLLGFVAVLSVSAWFYFEQKFGAEFAFVKWIFYIKLAGVISQTLISLKIVQYYSIRRIRPRFYLFVLLSLLNFGIFFPICYKFIGIDVFLLCAFGFSSLKVLFEIIYYKDVVKTQDQNRFLDRINDKKAYKVPVSFSVMGILLSLLTLSFYLSGYLDMSYLLSLFLCSFFYRLQSRFYRFLWVDFKRIHNNLLFKNALILRSVFILSLLNIIVAIYAGDTKYALGLQSVIFLLCCMELFLLQKKFFAPKNIIFISITFTALSFIHNVYLFAAVLVVLSFYIVYRTVKINPAGERYLTNYLATKNEVKIQFVYEFYGNGNEFKDIINYAHEKGFKTRRVGKRQFAICDISGTKKFDKDSFVSSFAENIRVFNESDYEIKLQEQGDSNIKRTIFGFWRGDLNVTLVRILNFHANRILFNFSNRSAYKSFKLHEKKYTVSSALGDSWRID